MNFEPSRHQYQLALPLRAKSEQKIYSAAEPSFFRTYRIETATDMLKSIPAGINRVQNYQLRVAMPELKNLFDGTLDSLIINGFSSLVAFFGQG